MNKDRIKTFADRVYRDVSGAMVTGMADIGTRTGLFRAMAGQGAMSVGDLTAATGLQARYVQEWLAGMTAAEYLEYDPEAETFTLPDEHAYLLASEGTDHFAGGLFRFAPVLLGVVPQVTEAFTKGGGVHFHEFGGECVPALDLINRGTYDQRFTSYWLAAMPEVMAQLETGVRVLDVGCGAGRVPINIATAFPNSQVVGLDPDASSIRLAETEAAASDVGNISFVCETTRTYAPDAKFDLMTTCDVVHDFAEPEATLAEMHALMKPGGVLFIVEPKAADRLEDNIHPLGAMYYGFSLLHCMTQSLANGGPGLGTCMGPARTEQLVREAGFSDFQTLPIKSMTNAFYMAKA
ncbi:MAG: class I SAM-dependent methyltransferase [Rhodobacter sp.]|jgi:2-polyprenyl-3-methyl-5-hydroxy-6-metoxy-1,4-benzoquinol methylase|nr:class I SAM-dependent methyltransferase [Rhodobacter sp.]